MKILIIDDEELLVKGIAYNLENEGYQVVTGSDGLEAIRLAQDPDVRLIVLDVMMPGMDGLEACRRIRQFSDVPIIMLTAKTEDMDKLLGFDCGADDYLTKPFALGELLARVRAMLRRREDFKPDILSFGDLQLNMQSYELSRGSEHVLLPKLEYQLMELLMRNHGLYLSTEDILTKIWGYETESDAGIVWVYLSYLRKRLAALGSTVSIRAKRGIGYTLEAAP